MDCAGSGREPGGPDSHRIPGSSIRGTGTGTTQATSRVWREPSDSETEWTGALIDRFISEEQLLEIRGQDPGPTNLDGLQYSTACSYLSMLERHIRPQWGAQMIGRVRPAVVLEWLKGLDMAPKYKG